MAVGLALALHVSAASQRLGLPASGRAFDDGPGGYAVTLEWLAVAPRHCRGVDRSDKADATDSLTCRRGGRAPRSERPQPVAAKQQARPQFPAAGLAGH